MRRIGTLEALYRYPVKSMAGEEVARAFVGYAGLMGDRCYAFARVDGRKAFPGIPHVSKRTLSFTSRAMLTPAWQACPLKSSAR